jgi:hypothetical protein
MISQNTRRVGAGHDATGNAVVLADGVPPHVTRPAHQPGLAFHELWNTRASPSLVSASELEPTDAHRDTAPSRSRTVIRIADIRPEGPNSPEFDKETVRSLFEQVGLGEKAEHSIPSHYPLIDRTESTGSGVVLQGQTVLLLNDSEVVLEVGDMAVQRGTIYAWTNRTTQMTRMLFMLTDGTFEPALALLHSQRDDKVKAAGHA